ncbi:MAG: gamma-glutamylcyclotransferase family protein [Woeseiaceae bacterium]
MRVFFYGLFMDESLLSTKGIRPVDVRLGFIDGYSLCIGERATLMPCRGGRAYGTIMDIAADEVTNLYAVESVADYLPETVTVGLADGTRVDATCYNLPADKVAAANQGYAAQLLDLATRLDFPGSYVDQIRSARGGI